MLKELSSLDERHFKINLNATISIIVFVDAVLDIINTLLLLLLSHYVFIY